MNVALELLKLRVWTLSNCYKIFENYDLVVSDYTLQTNFKQRRKERNLVEF